MEDTDRREGYIVRFDGKTRQPKRNYYDAYYTSLTRTGDSTYRMGFGYPMPDNNVGDFLVVRAFLLRLLCTLIGPCTQLRYVHARYIRNSLFQNSKQEHF